MKTVYHQLREKCIGQEHLLHYWNELSSDEQNSLAKEIAQTDFYLMENLHREVQNGPVEQKQVALKPLDVTVWKDLKQEKKDAYWKQGLQAIGEGKLAVLLVAGGQGTRLGHQGPKGTFDAGFPSGKSLFQLHTERLLYLSKLSGFSIPFVIMTSTENHQATVDFFKLKQFFGYSEADIHFFPQENLPILSEDGKVLMDSKFQIISGANGNGGCFSSLKKSGIFDKLRDGGIEYFFLFAIDNALVKVADPAFLGFALSEHSDVSCKAVAKAYPEEKVGILAFSNEKPSVIEYSDLDPELAKARNSDGKLIYNAGNIAIHLFSTKFLERCFSSDLPYHLARKKIAFLDTFDKWIEPAIPNAIKFELFMFDVFPLAKKMAVLEVAREEEFSPIKNSSGVDSPESARQMMTELHRTWLKNASAPEKFWKHERIEISPLLSYAGEGLENRNWDLNSPDLIAID